MAFALTLTACSTGGEPVAQTQQTTPPAVAVPGHSTAEVNENHRAELALVRSIDPCGFVDVGELSRDIAGFVSMTYGNPTSGWAPYAGYQAQEPRQLQHCVLRIEDALTIDVGVAAEKAGQAAPGPVALTIDGVQVRDCFDVNGGGTGCYDIDVPLSRFPDTPAGMHVPRIQIAALRGSSPVHDRKPELDRVATMVARRLSRDVPVRHDKSPVRLAVQDPCAAIDDVPGSPELKWREKPPERTLFDYTWRLPQHCTIIRWADSDPADLTNAMEVDFDFWRPELPPHSPFLKRRDVSGIDYWVDTSPAGDHPNSCHYIAQAGPAVAGKNGSGPTSDPQDERIPVVEVRTYSGPCELAEDIAIKAAQRAVG